MSHDYSQLVQSVRNAFFSGRTKSVEWRKAQLHATLQLLDEQEDKLLKALQEDLRKSKTESMGFELNMVRNEVINALNHIDEWVKPEKVKKNMVTMADSCYVRPEPLGVVLILGAWNYPMQLIFLPLLGAIEAGNCAILKPSELSESTAKLVEELVPIYYDKDCIKVVNGGVAETQALLKERFDYIFYTGSTNVGKIIMEAATKTLTPVTLELGGKSPCYVDKSSDLNLAARRIIWGKLANLGQTCVAPDYILCEADIRDLLVEEMKKTIKEFYGEDPQKSADLGRIVNKRHFHRVKALLGDGKIAHGGRTVENDLYIEPTIMVNVKPTDKVMQEEIFGPILPVITVKGVEDAIQFINSREKPLALYVFSKNDNSIDLLIINTTSGSMCVNDTLMQGSLDTLPFGGVGCSGMGAYHGKYSFDTFSHKRACMIRPQNMESLNTLRYPPFSDKKLEWVAWTMAKSVKRQGIYSLIPILMGIVVIAVLIKLFGLDAYIPIIGQ